MPSFRVGSTAPACLVHKRTWAEADGFYVTSRSQVPAAATAGSCCSHDDYAAGKYLARAPQTSGRSPKNEGADVRCLSGLLIHSLASQSACMSAKRSVY